MTTPARPGSFTGATDNAASGGLFTDTLIDGIPDIIGVDVDRAETAATNAEASATTATTQATSATASAATATTQATAASTDAASALASKTSATASQAAATASQTAAAASETAAGTSATNAAASQSAAASSATSAGSSNTTAAQSANSALSSASSASTSAGTATTQATSATASAATATTQAASATTQAAAALVSKNAAAASETAALASKNAAAASETAAGTSETNAAASKTAAETAETNAETAETNAETAETNAAASATSASTSATNAASSLTTFQGLFVASSSAPASPDVGDLWYDTTTSQLKVYVTGSPASWQIAGAYLQGLIANHTFTCTAGQTVFTTDDASGTMSIDVAANVFAYLNGVKLIGGGTDYSISGNTITLTSGAIVSDVLYVDILTKISTTQETALNALVTQATAAKTAAETAETNAETAETNAATSATAAGTSATNAATSATSASNSATSSATSATSSAGSLTSFNDIYRGESSTAPSSPATGQLWYDTTNTAMKVYSGSAWTAAYVSGTGFLATTGGALTGAVTTTSTFDGRDVAADGTKLDTIETNADVTDTVNVTAAGALMDSEVTNLAQVKAFDSSDYATAAQGTLAAAALPKAGGTMTGTTSHGDNVKSTWGTAPDLEVYHTGSHSRIADVGTGKLQLGSATQVEILNGDFSEPLAQFVPDGAVTLYHNNAAKIATTATGIDVTGETATDTLNVKSGTTADSTGQPSGNFAATVYHATNSSSSHGLLVKNNWAATASTVFEAGLDISGGAYRQYHKIDGTGQAFWSPGNVERMRVTGTGLEVTGNVVVSGTVDGRDVATDGTKLDGIEASADVTDATNVTAAGALMKTGGTMTGLLVTKTPTSTTVAGANDNSFSVRGDTTYPAVMSFHRGGAYAVNFGLSTANKMELGGWSASTIKHTWDFSGNYTATGNITAYSDERVKENIEVIPEALNKVKQLSGYTFDRTDFVPDAETGVMPETRQTGVIAQEVIKVLPEAVMTMDDGKYAVAYGNMVGLLIEAIKEQQVQIDELKATVESKGVTS